MALHLFYRPKSLDDLVGNDSVKNSLKNLMAREDRPHSYLLSGKTGCGKTSVARIIAEMLGCSAFDYYEFNVGNVRGIDTIRETLQNCHFAALENDIKVYVYDEGHRLTKDAQAALLKILEDTPKHIYFIICTTDPEQLLPTIRNRCTTFQLASLTDAQMKQLLNSVLKKEKIKDFSGKVLNEIVRVSEGCPRQALVVLDSVIDIIVESEALEAISVITISEVEVIDICRAIITKQPWRSIKSKVKDVLAKTEPEKLRYAILGYMKSVLLNKDQDDRVSEIIDIFSENTYSSGAAGIVNMIYLATK